MTREIKHVLLSCVTACLMLPAVLSGADKNIPMIKGLEKIYAGMPLKELLEVRPGIELFMGRSTQKKEDIDTGVLREQIERSEFHGLRLLITYTIKNKSLATMLILSVGDGIFKLYKERIVAELLQLWGNCDREIITLENDRQHRIPLLVWRRGNVFVSAYGTDKFKGEKGGEVFCLAISSNENDVTSFIDNDVDASLKQSLFSQIGL